MANRPWHGTARNSAGDAVALPTVTVYLAGTLTLATIYDDVGGLKVNPFSGAADGTFEFYVDETVRVDVLVEAAGFTPPRTFSDLPASVTAHGSLPGLTTGDPHTQYPFGAGRAAGQKLALGTRTTPVRELEVVGRVVIDQDDLAGAATHGAPLYITADTQAAPGGNACAIQCEITANPGAGAGSPGPGDYVIAKFSIDNLGRGELWGLNVVALQLGAGEHGSVRGVELEVGATSASTQLTDPFGPRGATESRVNGLELVVHSGSTARPAAALTTWANDDTGDGWWHNGIAVSRCFAYGLRFIRNPGGATDAIEPFQAAAISDESNSANVLKVAGSHGSVIDLSGGPTLTRFILGKSAAATDLLVGNAASQDCGITIDSGAFGGPSAHLSYVDFADRGTSLWSLRKDSSDNSLRVYNWFLGTTALAILGANNSVGIGTAAPQRTLHLSSAAPNMFLTETDQAADGKTWGMGVSGGTLFAFARNDADSAGANWLRALRTGTVIDQVVLAEGSNLAHFASAGSYGGGAKVLFLGNATTAPSTNPTGGGIVYVEAGALKYRGSLGTVTTLGPA